MKKLERHEFAVSLPQLSNLGLNLKSSYNKIIVKDKELVNRLFYVLRFENGNELILFDRLINAKVKILSFAKNGEIVFEVQEVKNNLILTPKITFLLPILKKTALEEAVYSLSEIGINSIQLINTQKSQNINFDQKYFERLNSIVISAAEQSKNFNYPEILAPVKLVDIEKKVIISQNNLQQKIYFDPAGKSCVELLSNNKSGNIIAMCGPEGDLTDSEKGLLKSLGFEFFALTQTVLRASQAVALGSGVLRFKL